jgi:Mg-chelatase subunit ChlD
MKGSEPDDDRCVLVIEAREPDKDDQLEEVPLDVVICVDNSGSMKLPTGDGKSTRIAALRTALADLIEELAGTRTRLAIVYYNDKVRYATPPGQFVDVLESNKQAPIDSATAIEPCGPTDIGAALDVAVGFFELRTAEAKRVNKPMIFLMTDGEPNRGAATFWQLPRNTREALSEIPTKVVLFGDSETPHDLVSQVAHVSGGEYATTGGGASFVQAIRSAITSEQRLAARDVTIEIRSNVPSKVHSFFERGHLAVIKSIISGRRTVAFTVGRGGETTVRISYTTGAGVWCTVDVPVDTTRADHDEVGVPFARYTAVRTLAKAVDLLGDYEQCPHHKLELHREQMENAEACREALKKFPESVLQDDRVKELVEQIDWLCEITSTPNYVKHIGVLRDRLNGLTQQHGTICLDDEKNKAANAWAY